MNRKDFEMQKEIYSLLEQVLRDDDKTLADVRLRMPPRARETLEKRFGLADNNNWGMSYEETAASMGITVAGVRANEKKGFSRLRHRAGIITKYILPEEERQS